MSSILATFPISVGAAILAMLIYAVACALQGTIGFGSAVIAGPFLLLIDPRFIPGPLLVGGALLTILILNRDGARARIGDVVRINVARLAGSGIGALVLLYLSPTGLSIFLAVLLLFVVIASGVGLTIKHTRFTVLTTGVASGFAGTIAGLGGAVTSILFQNARGAELRGGMAAYMLPGGFIAIGFVVLAGRLGPDELLLAVVLLPGLVVGHLVATRYAGVLEPYVSKPAVLAVSGTAAVWVLARALWTIAVER